METEKKTSEPIISVHDVVRSASIGFILIVFAALKLPYLAQKTAEFNNKTVNCDNITPALDVLCSWGLCFDICENIDETLGAFSVSITGLALIIMFSIIGIGQATNPQAECGKKASGAGFVTMLGLVFGGLCYMSGYWIIMDIQLNSELRKSKTEQSDVVFWNWWLTIWFFEFYLGGITAIMFGVNSYFKMWDDKLCRIFVILSQLLIVSLVLFIGYTYVAVEVGDEWKLPLIASGYGLILLCCLGYTLFYFIVRNQKGTADGEVNQVIVKWVICVLLIIGSILVAIGHWAQFNEYDPYKHSWNSWNTGYCLLLIGVCAYNATDIMDSEPTQYDAISKEEN